MISEEVIREVKAVVEPMKPELKDLSIKIHDNPELGLQEYKACEWQIEILHKYGFIVTENFCDIPTAYKAVYSGKKSGPKIAMLSEYDALPGIGHGCGHNLICMISIGSGIAMRKFADEYGAEIYVIGTPAEETEGAKVKMARLGVFKDVDVVMMSHPNYRNSSSVNFQALNARKVEFFGKSAHAAAAPEQGRSALEATISLFNMVDMSRQHISTDVRISGIIVDGGKAPNIVPEYASSIWYLRAAREATLDAVMDRFANICKAASLGTGTTVRVTPVEADFKDTVCLWQSKNYGRGMLTFFRTFLGCDAKLFSVSYRLISQHYIQDQYQGCYLK